MATRARSTPDEEFARLLLEHRGALIRYALRRVSDLSSAEDLVAEVFVVAWRRRDQLPPREEEMFWLYGVAHNVLRNMVRSRGRSLRLEARLASERQGEAPASSVDFTALGEGLVALAEDDQEILRLVYWEGLSLREVGAVLDCTEKAAGIRVSRARSRLREVMAERVTSASEGQ